MVSSKAEDPNNVFVLRYMQQYWLFALIKKLQNTSEILKVCQLVQSERPVGVFPAFYQHITQALRFSSSDVRVIGQKFGVGVTTPRRAGIVYWTAMDNFETRGWPRW